MLNNSNMMLQQSHKEGLVTAWELSAAMLLLLLLLLLLLNRGGDVYKVKKRQQGPQQPPLQQTEAALPQGCCSGERLKWQQGTETLSQLQE